MDKTKEFYWGLEKGYEATILGVLLISPEKMGKVEKLIKPDNFFLPEHILIYSTMVSLYRKTGHYDIITVIDKLKERGKLDEAGGQDYISGMTPNLPVDLEYQISRMKERVKRRELKTKLVEYADDADSGEYDYSALIENIYQNISDRRIDIEKENLELLDRPYTFNDLENDLRKTPEGLKTGFTQLDEAIRIKPGTITIIGARPSHGKTALMMNILLNMLKEYDKKVFYFFSYEEPRKRIGAKLINTLGEYIIDKKRNTEQIENYIRGRNTHTPEIENGKNIFKNYTQSGRLKIIDEPLFVDELSNYLEYVSRQHKIGAIFIDYIQKIKVRGKYDRYIEIKKASETILEAANRLSIPIILGAQLGRGKEYKGGKNKVRMDNLRESGDIEQDANLILGILNPIMEKILNEESNFNQSESESDIIELTITIMKNRDGGNINKEIELKFNPPILKISDVIISPALDRMRRK